VRKASQRPACRPFPDGARAAELNNLQIFASTISQEVIGIPIGQVILPITKGKHADQLERSAGRRLLQTTLSPTATPTTETPTDVPTTSVPTSRPTTAAPTTAEPTPQPAPIPAPYPSLPMPLPPSPRLPSKRLPRV
jgi:hypothetical protein